MAVSPFKPAIFKREYTMTTSNGGSILVQSQPGTAIAAETGNTNGYIMLPFRVGTAQYFMVLRWYDLEPVKNTEVTFTVTYVQ